MEHAAQGNKRNNNFLTIRKILLGTCGTREHAAQGKRLFLNDKNNIMDFNKTDEELKQMGEDEFFAYLDAKAKYLAQNKAPLSYHKTLRFASLSSSLSNIEFDYDGAIKSAEKNKEEGDKKFNDKKAKE